MQLDHWIIELSKAIELPAPLPKDAAGFYIFPVEDNVAVTISEYKQGFSLFCHLTSAPEQNQEEFFTQMLLANLFGQGTKGAVLGLNTEGKAITLSLDLDRASYRDFRDALEDFLNTVDFWRTEALPKPLI